MNNIDLSNKISSATKWATITEFLAKIIVPITNLILARLITPEAFGVIAIITIIISFADMLTDSGFQKYIIQKEFSNKIEMDQSFNVAFWSNLILSFFIWIIMVICRDQIATLVGNEELGIVIAISGISLPLTSFISIQTGIYRRNFDFKTLFYTRIMAVFIPFLVTVPLALLGFSYWSLILGTIAANLASAVFLTYKSTWKPKLYYSFSVLKKMLSFSIWSLIEALSIWMTTYIGTFIVASALSTYYLGLYNTTIITVNGILAIVTTATTSVLFSSLSRLQNNETEFLKVFFQFIRLVSVIILPMGVGIFVFRDIITSILLGEQWKEASFFLGIWGLTSSITIVLGQYCSEIYRAKGKPKISLLVQVLHMIALIPTMIITASYGFDYIVIGYSLIKLQLILCNWLVIYFIFGISPLLIINNVIPSLISASIMGGVAFLLKNIYSNYLWELLVIFISIVLYFLLLFLFPKIRVELVNLFQQNIVFSFKRRTVK
ncbi:lipopolysaccharide biosynthesis protein [Planococcus sp. N064]|uniref:Lipopolysaccharide biosynthesis protein n=1 Tax=Planococcus liqunii TaxID=3058394 RepID=A0ABT8MNF5_9BACL|nr:lipopolysaccharide biosynthesis protein [Planococcus sp. N064]MDN7226429.1 lipopolysaccharide biosynthesis protein [Planococcus sp. N064]